MSRILSGLTVGTFVTCCLSACGGSSGPDDSGPPPPPPALTSYVGTTGVFAAWVNTNSGEYAVAPTGSYAGKKQSLRGTIDFMTGAPLSQPAGVEIYKGADGHIYGLDLTSSSAPTAQQLSNETAATVDDTCTLSGTAVAGADYDYLGVYFTGDLQNPTHSSYFYRLPGPDGACNTPDDVIHLVKTGMSANSAPIVAFGMPVATVRTAQGGIAGFVVKSDASLVMVDSNFANPVVLGTFPAAINVAVALPVGTTEGYPTGQLYVVDGDIVYVNYASPSVSNTLYTIPNWTPTNAGALFAASPNTLYFSINTPAAGSLYAMPADGSAVPTLVDTEPGRVATLLFPVEGTKLLYGVSNYTASTGSSYTILSLPAAGGTATALVTSPQNGGTFFATASTVYYDTWTASTNNTTKVVTRSGTQSGIISQDGTVIQPPLASSTFVNGGEQQPWPNASDTTTTNTPYETIFQVRGLTTVTVTNSTTGYQYVEDGVGGGSLVAIDATSNQVIGTLGSLPMSNATALTDTFRGAAHTGFLEATSPVSTQDPATRDLYVVDTQAANSLQRLTGNL